MRWFTITSFWFATIYGTNFSCYRAEINGVNEYVFQSNTMLPFFSHYGQFSPQIFDFDNDGVCGSSDLIQALSGYGQTITPINLDSIYVVQTFSSGWIIEVPEYQVAFLKVSAYDEGGEFVPEPPINSFWLQLVDEEGNQIKYYYHGND